MAKNLPSTGPWRGLAAVTASLLAVSVGATSIVNNNAAFINQKLGLTSFKVVDTAEGEEKDSIYFKSEYSSLEELIQAKEALAEEIASEGAVLFKNLDHSLPLDVSSENVTLWGLNSINPTLGGMIGSSVSVYSDGGQKQYGIVDALEEKGFSLNQDMLKLYQSEDVNGTYGRKNGHSLTPSFGKTYENPAAYKVGEAPDSIYKDDVLKSADDTAAIVVLSRDNSEAADYNPDMKSSDENDSFERPLALSSNNAQGLMTAFNRAGTSYSGAFRNLLVNILRNEWGYKGWIVTDMINGADYMNWRDVTAGGGGGSLTSSAYDTSTIGGMAASKSDIQKDMAFQENMRNNIKYFLYQIVQSNAMNGISSTTEIVYVRTWLDNALTAATIATAALTVIFLALAVMKLLKKEQTA